MDDRSNTIAGWVLAGGIVALGLSIVSGMYFHGEAPEKEGFAVAAEAGGEAGGACWSRGPESDDGDGGEPRENNGVAGRNSDNMRECG